MNFFHPQVKYVFFAFRRFVETWTRERNDSPKRERNDDVEEGEIVKKGLSYLKRENKR